MSLLSTVAEIFQNKMGSQTNGLDTGSIISALQGLLPTNGGELDIAGLIATFSQQGGLQDMVKSWMGSGGNDNISADQILKVLGDANVGEFASKLGLGKESAASGLSDMIPQLVDQFGGGNLGDSVMNVAKGFFK